MAKRTGARLDIKMLYYQITSIGITIMKINGLAAAARRETAGVQNRQPSVQYVLDPVLEHKRKIV